MRCLTLSLLVCLSMLMTGCSGRIDLSDISSTAGATAGAAVGAATGVGLPATVILTTTGGVAGGALVEDDDSATEILETIPEEQRAEVAKTQAFWMFVEHFLEWIVGAVVALIVIAWLIPGPQFTWRRNHANTSDTSKSTGHDGVQR